MFKELKKTIIKEVKKKGMVTMSHQIYYTKKETEKIKKKKNQMEILKLKNK